MVNSKPYIGESIDLYGRLYNHLRHNSEDSYLYYSIDKQLRDPLKQPLIAFTVLELTPNLSKHQMRELESQYINRYNSFLGGYNMRIHNERPTQSIELYMDVMRQTNDLHLREQLKQQLLAKIEMLPRYLRREYRRRV
jgi:hypothetical protein